MWFAAFDAKTGTIRAELPLIPTSEISTMMRTITTAGFKLPVNAPGCPQNWEQVTEPYSSWIVVCDSNEIVWGGLIQTRQRSSETSTVTLSCISPEDYLDRRYMPTKTFTQTGQAEILTWMINNAITPNGIPFQIDNPNGPGKLRDRTYYADSNETIYRRMSELAEVIDGPEWWISLEWVQNGYNDQITPTLHIGNPQVGDPNNDTVFSIPGNLLEATLEERKKVGEFATQTRAVGAGEGEDTPTSDTITNTLETLDGYPRVELVKNYPTTTDKTTLNTHAKALNETLKNGVKIYSLTRESNTYPLFRQHYTIGDTITLELDTATLKISQKLRVIGWTLSADGTKSTVHVAQIGGTTQ